MCVQYHDILYTFDSVLGLHERVGHAAGVTLNSRGQVPTCRDAVPGKRANLNRPCKGRISVFKDTVRRNQPHIRRETEVALLNRLFLMMLLLIWSGPFVRFGSTLSGSDALMLSPGTLSPAIKFIPFGNSRRQHCLTTTICQSIFASLFEVGS